MIEQLFNLPVIIIYFAVICDGTQFSAPARHISEGAAPCPYFLALCPIIQRPAQIIYYYLLFMFF